MSRVLRKPVYKGYKAYNQSHVKDYLSQERIYHCERDYSLVKGDFPSIVSEKLWDTCFAIRKDRAAHNVDKEGRTYGFGTSFPQNKWAKVLYCECGARYQCECIANLRHPTAYAMGAGAQTRRQVLRWERSAEPTQYIAGCWRKWQKRSLRQHGQSTGKKYVRAAANYAANKLTAEIRRTRYANAKNGWRRS